MRRQKYQNFESMSQMTSVYDPLDVKLTVIQEFLSFVRVLLPSCVDMERRFDSFNHRPIEQSGLITVLTS